MNIQHLLKGEKLVAKIALDIAPHIEKHFKPFNGKRALLSGGGKSAIFRKVCNNFLNELGFKPPINVYVNISGSMVKIDIKTCMKSERSDSWDYFEGVLYIGEIPGYYKHGDYDKETFAFKFDQGEGSYFEYYNRVLKTTEKQALKAMKDYKALEEKQDAILKSVPSALTSIIKRGY